MRPVICPVIVGRDRELKAVDEASDAALQRRGAFVVISGQAGIGKSRLVAEAQGRAEARGLRVLRGRASEGGDVPYRPLAEAVQSALRADGPPGTPTLEPFRASLGRLVPEWARRPVQEAESRFVLPEAVLRLLRVLARRDGLLLVIEDLHWADPDTLAVIEYLADSLGSDRLLCICTERSDLPSPAADMLATLVARRAASRIALRPLPDEAVEELARLSLEVDAVSPAVVGALRRFAGGVPFLVEEMLSAYLAAGGPAGRRSDWWVSHRVAKDLPASYRDLVRARLASLGNEGHRVLAAGAVLGRTFDRRLIGQIIGLGEPALLEALCSAAQAQLITGAEGSEPPTFSFRHALAREAVLAELSPRKLADLFARAADAIEEAHPGLPGEWCERAADLRAQAGDRVGAHRLLREAGRRALARGALASAECSLERAHELVTGDHTASMGVGELLLETLALEGKTDRLVELGRSLLTASDRYLAAELVPRSRLAQLNLHVARSALLGEDVRLARDCLAKARELADDEALVSRVESASARLALTEGDPARARAQAGSAAAVAKRLDLHDLACEALETQGQAAFRLGDLGGASAAFEQMADVARSGGLTAQRMHALVEVGTLDHLIRAEPGRLREAERVAVRVGAMSTLARINLEMAWMHLGLAEVEEARRTLGRSLEACRGFRLRLLQHALVAEAALHGLMGRREKMERACGEALVAADGDPNIEAGLLGNGNAVLKLVLGDESGALDDLERAVGVAERAVKPQPWWFHGLYVLLRTGKEDGGAARDALRDPDLANPTNRAYLAYADALAADAGGRALEAASAFGRADSLMPPGWRRHHARLVLGEKARSAGWSEPGVWAEEALAFAEHAGMDWLAGRARALMGRAGTELETRARLVASAGSGLRARVA